MQCHLHDPWFLSITGVTHFLSKKSLPQTYVGVSFAMENFMACVHVSAARVPHVLMPSPISVLKILKDVISPAVKQQPVPQIPHNKALPWSSALTRLLQCDQWSNKQIHATCFTGSRAFAVQPGVNIHPISIPGLKMLGSLWPSGSTVHTKSCGLAWQRSSLLNSFFHVFPLANGTNQPMLFLGFTTSRRTRFHMIKLITVYHAPAPVCNYVILCTHNIYR